MIAVRPNADKPSFSVLGTVYKSSASLLRSLVAFILLFTCSSIILTTNAQPTALEKAALDQILVAYPDLRSVPSWERFPDDNTDYGRNWVNGFPNLCDQDGYSYYGVNCKNGHIFGLRVTAFFGTPLSTNFSNVVHLTHLKNYTFVPSQNMPSTYFCSELEDSIIFSHPLEHLEAYSAVVNDSFPFASLRNLTAIHANGMSYSSSVNLEYLSLMSETGETPNLGTLPNLKEIRLVGPFNLSQLLVDTNSTNVSSISCYDCYLPQVITFHSGLTTLTLSCSTGASQISLLELTSGSLESLSACTANVTLNTPMLKTLSCGYANPTSLPRLKSLALLQPSISLSSVTSNLCDLLPNLDSGIETIKVVRPTTEAFAIPSCLLSLSSLRKMDLSQARTDSGSVFQFLPPSITSLSLGQLYPDSSQVNLSSFLTFRSLTELTLWGADAIMGTIPEDFFQKLPNLELFHLSSSNIVGTVPWYGWSHMVDFYLVANVDSWPGIDLAPNLKSFKISSRVLSVIPGDEALSASGLTLLETFDIDAGLSLDGPIPAFWTTLPHLQSVAFVGIFTGPLPPLIQAPRLQSLRVIGNQLCGTLPDFFVPTHLKSLYLGPSDIRSYIPPSWERNLTIIHELLVATSLLSGTIPSGFLSHHGLQMRSIRLDNNYMEDSLWDMTSGAPRYQLYISNTNFNICSILPTMPASGIIERCELSSIPECPTGECLTRWTEVCGAAPCTQRPYRLEPRHLPCVAPPPRESPPQYSPQTPSEPCPTPIPSGFQCVNGQWVSSTPISLPSITLPPNSGVVTINGNFSTTGPVTFSGAGTTLEVNGCIEILEEVIIEVDPNNPPPKSTYIHQKGSDCPTDVSLVHVRTKSTKDSCKSVHSSTSESSKSALVVLFTIDRSRCNTKWIILGCVLGAVAIFATIGIIIFVKVSAPANPLKNQ